MVALVAFAALVWPLIDVGATGEIVLTGRVALDHADDPPSDRSVEYRILETGNDRLQMEGQAAEALRPGQRVRARGRRVGGRFVLSAGSRSVTVTASAGPSATGQTDAAAGSPGTAPGEDVTAAADPSPSTVNKRVGVLLINFVQPTPSPSPTPVPTSTPSPTPPPTPTPTSPATPTPTPLPTPTPTSPATPTPTPLPTPTPTSSATSTPTPPPTPTPTPSASTAPTPPPTPTATPTPTPTPTPPPQPWTVESVRNVYFGSSSSVASYYAELSEGRVQVSGDVFGWFTLSISTTTCDYNNWATAARGAATLAGIDLSAYTNIAYAFPKQQACWWSGLASLPGKHSWMNGTTSLFITSHELGHNFGVHHASSMRCTKSGSRVQYSSNCSVDEYGDPFDVMGHKGQRHMSNWRRWQLGYLSASDVLTVGGHGTYRMATAQVPGGAPRIVRVPRPSGDYYYLEYRQPYGQYDNFSPTAAVVNGVTVRIAAGVTSRSQSKLLDANPATTSWSDAAIPVGGTFVDPINGIRITTLSIDPGGATVHVQLGTDVVPPGPPTDLSAEMTVEGDVRLAWSPAPDDMGVSSYTVTRGGQLLGTVADAPFTDVAPPQGVTHDYAVQAVDAAGNSGAPATASVYVPDTTRPSVPTASTAQATGPRTVTISWTAATDNVGVVAYEVHRDSAVLATTEATTLVDEAATDGRLNSYEIRAVDGAGNRSEPAFTGIALADITAPVLTGDLVATLVSPTSVALAWPEASDNVGVAAYEVRRDGIPLTSVDTPGYVDADRAQGLAYMYEVTAVDAAGNRSATPASSIRVPDTFAPSAPGDLAGALTGPHSLDLGWTAASDNVGVDRYEVTRDGQSLGSVEVPSLTGIAVVEGGTYRFTVWAIDAAGNEGVAAEVTVIVPDVTAPSGTTLSAAASGSTAASLSWAAATDNVGVAGYVVIRDGQVAATLAANAFSFVDSGLASDRRYSYAVYAFDRAGNAGPAATSSVTLTSVDVVPPSVPANLVGRSLDRRWVKLTWLASTDNRPGTLRYQVFRGTRKIATVTTLSHLDRPASVGTYKYRVRALDAAGNKSAFSAAIWVRAVRRV